MFSSSIDRNLLPVIKLGDHTVPWKSSVSYLDSLFTEDNSTLAAAKHNICCAASIVKWLMPRVFGRRPINGALIGQFVSSSVFILLLYGLQYWQARTALYWWLLPSSCKTSREAPIRPSPFGRDSHREVVCQTTFAKTVARTSALNMPSAAQILSVLRRCCISNQKEVTDEEVDLGGAYMIRRRQILRTLT